MDENKNVTIWLSSLRGKSKGGDYIFLLEFCQVRTVSKAMVIGRAYFQLLESPNLQTVLLLPRHRVNISQYGPRGRIVRGYSLCFKYVLN